MRDGGDQVREGLDAARVGALAHRRDLFFPVDIVNGRVFYQRRGKDSSPHDGKQIYLGPGKDFSL